MGSNVTAIGSRGARIIGSGGTQGASATPISAAYDTGALFGQEATAWSKWVFSFIIASGAGTGFTCTWYGTIDPNTAYGAGAFGGVSYSVGTANWFQLPAPAVETAGDTTALVNPQTVANTVLYSVLPLVAVRCNVTVTGQSGSILLLVYATQ